MKELGHFRLELYGITATSSPNLSGCAHAADPWSLTINLAQIRGAGGGGAAPPRTPLLFRGASPPGPPKRRSAPLVAAVVRFLATEPLVWGRTFLPKSDFF